MSNDLSPALSRLAEMVRGSAGKVKDTSEKQDFVAASERLRYLAEQIEQWREQEIPGSVYWVESTSTRLCQRIKLATAPIDIGPAIRERLLKKVPSVVFTSATLAVGRPASSNCFTPARCSAA